MARRIFRLDSCLAEACAHIERDTIAVRHRDGDVVERCSVTGAVVMLGFEAGNELCCRLEDRGERIPVLWLVPALAHHRARRLLAEGLERYVDVEPVDMLMLWAWLDRVRPCRRSCEARRIAREHALSARQTEVLVARARHQGHVALTELALELCIPESTLRRDCDVIKNATGRNIHRLAADLAC